MLLSQPTISQEEILKLIEKDIEKEMSAESAEVAEKCNDVFKQKHGIMKRVYFALLGRLLGKLKVKVTIYWNDNVLFEYVIPK